MTSAHLHLMITHLPVFGSILGAFIMGYGLWSKSNSTKIAAYCLFIVSGIGAGIAYLTGEGAEKAVEKIAGVSENLIKVHEDSAIYALVSLIVLGLISVFALWITYKKSSLIKYVAAVTLLVSFISFGLVARTGYLGGQIRHTEIGSGAVQTNVVEKAEKDDD
ncbi:MAG: DUF2231 domain-containing protein [Ferruginibacter sp.]